MQSSLVHASPLFKFGAAFSAFSWWTERMRREITWPRNLLLVVDSCLAVLTGWPYYDAFF